MLSQESEVELVQLKNIPVASTDTEIDALLAKPCKAKLSKAEVDHFVASVLARCDDLESKVSVFGKLLSALRKPMGLGNIPKFEPKAKRFLSYEEVVHQEYLEKQDREKFRILEAAGVPKASMHLFELPAFDFMDFPRAVRKSEWKITSRKKSVVKVSALEAAGVQQIRDRVESLSKQRPIQESPKTAKRRTIGQYMILPEVFGVIVSRIVIDLPVDTWSYFAGCVKSICTVILRFVSRPKSIRFGH